MVMVVALHEGHAMVAEQGSLAGCGGGLVQEKMGMTPQGTMIIKVPGKTGNGRIGRRNRKNGGIRKRYGFGMKKKEGGTGSGCEGLCSRI